MPRLLILSVSAGNGHVRAAQALTATGPLLDPPCGAVHIDAMAHVTASFRKVYTDWYLQLVNRAPELWSWLHQKADSTPHSATTQRLRRGIERLNARALLQEVRRVKPDAVICTHFLPIEARPLVHLTFGTVVNRSEALVLATRALADLDARVVVTIGTDGDASLLDSPPSNVMSSGSSRKRCSCRIARWLFRMGALVRFCRPWRMECPSWLCRKARISSSTRQRSRTGAPVWPSGKACAALTIRLRKT